MDRERQAAFARIMEAHGGALGRVADCYAREGADREDLSQEIGLAIWRALPRFRRECSERTFAMRIAHNRGLCFAFRRRRHAAEPERELADPGPGPEEAVGAGQRRELLFSAIRALPVGLRQVLVLALEGLDHREIAEVVGISENNVAVRCNRARAALRRLLEVAR